MLRLSEMSATYPLFCLRGFAGVTRGVPLELSWKGRDGETATAIVVPEDVVGSDVYVRVANPRDLSRARGVSGPSLAARLFTRSDGTLALVGAELSPLEQP